MQCAHARGRPPLQSQLLTFLIVYCHGGCHMVLVSPARASSSSLPEKGRKNRSRGSWGKF